MKILFNCYRFKNSVTVEETIFIEHCAICNISQAIFWGNLIFHLTYSKDGWILNQILIGRE